jgi:hypothetical protein
MDAHEDDVFPNKDFFPDIDNLFGDMCLTDDNTNDGSASAPAPTPYVFLVFACVLQFLGLAIDLDMLDMFCSYQSLVNMVCLISMLSAIFCSLFSWIKFFGKLLIFPTRFMCAQMHYSNLGGFFRCSRRRSLARWTKKPHQRGRM